MNSGSSGDEAEEDEAPVAEHAAPAAPGARPAPLARVQAAGPREQAERPEGHGTLADLVLRPPPRAVRVRLLEHQHHEDQVEQAAGAGDEEQGGERRAQRQDDRRQRRPDHVAGADHQSHEAVALGAQVRAQQVGGHGVARRQVQRPADAAVHRHQDADRPEAVDEREAAVGDRLAQRAAHHDGAPAVPVAEAAGEGLERQSHQSAAAHDQPDDGGRDSQAPLQQQRGVGERETDRDEVEEGAADQQPEAAGEHPQPADQRLHLRLTDQILQDDSA